MYETYRAGAKLDLAGLQAIESPITRDMLLLRIQRDLDPGNREICAQIADSELSAQCEGLANKLHLHPLLTEHESP